MKKTLLQFCVMATVAIGLVFFASCTGGDKKADESAQPATEQPAAQPVATDTAAAAQQPADTTHNHEGGH